MVTFHASEFFRAQSITRSKSREPKRLGIIFRSQAVNIVSLCAMNKMLIWWNYSRYPVQYTKSTISSVETFRAKHPFLVLFFFSHPSSKNQEIFSI